MNIAIRAAYKANQVSEHTEARAAGFVLSRAIVAPLFEPRENAGRLVYTYSDVNGNSFFEKGFGSFFVTNVIALTQ